MSAQIHRGIALVGALLLTLVGASACGDACVRNSDCAGALVCSAGECIEEVTDSGTEMDGSTGDDDILDAGSSDGSSLLDAGMPEGDSGMTGDGGS